VGRDVADGVDSGAVVEALADGHAITAALGQDGADRADVGGRSSALKRLSPSRPVGDSMTSLLAMPRPLMAKTSLPSRSRLARTHNSQRMQRLKSMTKSGWEASRSRRGKKWVKWGASMPV
jgi:hypothetical protein